MPNAKRLNAIRLNNVHSTEHYSFRKNNSFSEPWWVPGGDNTGSAPRVAVVAGVVGMVRVGTHME